MEGNIVEIIQKVSFRVSEGNDEQLLIIVKPDTPVNFCKASNNLENLRYCDVNNLRILN